MAVFYELALKINYSVEVWGEKQKPIHQHQGRWTVPQCSR